jgi:hypothetical protein
VYSLTSTVMAPVPDVLSNGREQIPSPMPRGVNRGTSRLISFLKPVAASAACPAPTATTLGGVVQTGRPTMAVYSPTGNANSPFHAEPAHDLVNVAAEDIATAVIRRELYLENSELLVP